VRLFDTPPYHFVKKHSKYKTWVEEIYSRNRVIMCSGAKNMIAFLCSVLDWESPRRLRKLLQQPSTTTSPADSAGNTVYFMTATPGSWQSFCGPCGRNDNQQINYDASSNAVVFIKHARIGHI